MTDAEQIEVSLEQVRELIAKRDMAIKLSNNREFKKLVLEGYFKEEAARLASVSAEPALEARREAIFGEIMAISNFRQYLDGIVRTGDMAAENLAEYEEALAEARQEGEYA